MNPFLHHVRMTGSFQCYPVWVGFLTLAFSLADLLLFHDKMHSILLIGETRTFISSDFQTPGRWGQLFSLLVAPATPSELSTRASLVWCRVGYFVWLDNEGRGHPTSSRYQCVFTSAHISEEDGFSILSAITLITVMIAHPWGCYFVSLKAPPNLSSRLCPQPSAGRAQSHSRSHMKDVVIREAEWILQAIQLVRDGMGIRNRPAARPSLAVNNRTG